jgi:hypothetical protein
MLSALPPKADLTPLRQLLANAAIARIARRLAAVRRRAILVLRGTAAAFMIPPTMARLRRVQRGGGRAGGRGYGGGAEA